MGKSARVEDSGAARELIAAAKNGNEAAVRTIIRTHNRMLFRLARSILPTDDDAEDVVQAAYVHAFTALVDFRGESSLRTWLGRIVLNEALGRARRTRPSIELAALEHLSTAEIIPFPRAVELANPEDNMARYEIRRVIEQAIDELPVAFRTVLVARLVEELSVEETADLLGLRPETVKTRLYRARALLRRALERQLGGIWDEVFEFGGERCLRIADRVVTALRYRG